MFTKNNIVTNTILCFSQCFTISSIHPLLQNNSTSLPRYCAKYVQEISITLQSSEIHFI